MYVDEDVNGLVVADTDFNEEILPLASIPKDVLSQCKNVPETRVTVIREKAVAGVEGSIVNVRVAARSEAKLEAFGGGGD